MPLLSRRRFLACNVGAAALTAAFSSLLAASAPAVDNGAHPKPRPGITAEKVATRKQVAATPHVVEVFDLVRPDRMAAHCPICQVQARLVHRMHKAGRSLDEIRRGVDARFG